MNLQEEIDTRRTEIQTAGYPMSVGEIVNLYKDGDLDIHPEFQRYFRWSYKQKSRFIESLLLGIPIPSIFVFQRHDGVWDLIDGLQRVSTILEFMGDLRDKDGNSVEGSRLSATDYLTQLEGVRWSKEVGGFDPETDTALTPEQQRLIKRAALDVKIVNRESDEQTKFDLFQRLNTGGSQLSDQEVRNSMLIMVNPEYYRWVDGLRQETSFQESIAIADRFADQQYDQELVLRFLLLSELPEDELAKIGDLGDFLTDGSIAAARDARDLDEQALKFRQVFSFINGALGDAAFKRFDPAKGKFLGGFTVSTFEAVSSGVAANLDAYLALPPEEANSILMSRAQDLWSESTFRRNSGSGVRASTRVPRIIPFARNNFKP
ncbi:DUF262 domain-containing protein [Micrococcus luteus]|uniref:DUF262 domain-containing protein n=1 Tax=Micrococcus luteus TaxID=1270 RepID=UPI0022E77EC3|nr:DUF262 domain-containing protein [Micrococcus luteus]